MKNRNGDYGGHASFTFNVERILDKNTGQYFFCDDKSIDTEDDKYAYVIVCLEVKGKAYYVAGKTHGPPEYCFPDESDCEVEIILGPDGYDWTKNMSEIEMKTIRDMMCIECAEDDNGYDP